MKALVVYDTQFGNTEKVAKLIGKSISNDTQVLHIEECTTDDFKGIDLLVVGAPTQAFSPKKEMKKWLAKLPEKSLKGMKVAAFDTRAAEEEIKKNLLLKPLVGMLGYAAEPIAKMLVEKGGEQVGNVGKFEVVDIEGPMKEGEMERAKKWARGLV